MNPWVINPYDLSEEFRVCTYPNVMPGMFAISNYGRFGIYQNKSLQH